MYCSWKSSTSATPACRLRNSTSSSPARHTVDVTWKLTNDQGRRQLEAEGRGVDQIPYSLRFEPLTKRLVLPGAMRVGDPDAKLRLWALMVVRAVINEPGVTGKQLHAVLRMPNEDKGRVIEHAEGQGWIKRDKDGKATRHSPTETGRVAVKEADS
jgi:hypothetical protein